MQTIAFEFEDMMEVVKHILISNLEKATADQTDVIDYITLFCYLANSSSTTKKLPTVNIDISIGTRVDGAVIGSWNIRKLSL